MLWSQSLEIGIRDLDEQNRVLFSYIDTLMNSENERGALEVMDILEEYALKHFADEQKLHAESEYPDADPHKRLHESFVVSFRRLKKRYMEDGPTLSNLLSFNRNVVEWLKRHIRSNDMAFAAYYNELPDRNVV